MQNRFSRAKEHTVEHGLNLKVVAVEALCDDVVQLSFEAVQGVLPVYGPGDHLDFHLSLAGKPQLRSYSLVGAWRAGAPYTIAVRQLPLSRGGSTHMGTLQVGDVVQASGPLGHFPLSFVASARPAFLAGGIGITPLVGMIEALLARGIRPSLHYAGRSRAAMPYLARLQACLADDLHVWADDEGGGPGLSTWLSGLTADTDLYMCGPAGMLASVIGLWASQGREASRLRFETFGHTGTIQDEGFEVSVPRLGVTLAVGRDETLLEALEREGLRPLHNCRRGECGLCAVEVHALEGKIDHRDVFFSAEQKAAGEAFCSCVSRVSGKVAIDLP